MNGEQVDKSAVTDEEWREFQSIPDQGYSHRGWVDAIIKQRLAAAAPATIIATSPADETAVHSALRELMLVGHADDPHDPICRAKGFIRAALATTPADADTAERIAQAIEVEMRRHDRASVGFSAVGDAYAHAARIAREHATTPPVAATSEEADRTPADETADTSKSRYWRDKYGAVPPAQSIDFALRPGGGFRDENGDVDWLNRSLRERVAEHLSSLGYRLATTSPFVAIDLPGLEGARSALDALTTRKAKTDD